MILSNVKRIRREDIPNAPDWIDRIITPFNILVDTVSNAFAKKITLGDNVQSFYKEIEFTTVPFTFENKLPVKPQTVILSQIWKKDDPTATIGAVTTCEWDLTSQGIRIKYIGTLAAATYVARFLVL
jgi:hypothetical protein